MKNRRWIGLGAIIVAALALAVAGWLHWRHGRLFPSTDNAYVDGDATAVASRIPGTLQAVSFRDHEWVDEGRILVELDPRDYDQAVTAAAAELAKAGAALDLDRAEIAGAEAQVAVARSQHALAQADRERYAALQDKGSVPERQYEQAATAADVTAAQLAAAEKMLMAARARLTVDERKLDEARAKHDRALLQRSYCTVTAPCAGMVADKSAQAGQVVAPGQPLCRIVPLTGEHIWIDANFKETQIERIRPGQPVTIEVDADPGREYTGRVTALSAGTGAAFSLLPAQNATGNWVKIVQRVPVRITIDPGADPEHRLRLGLSTRVTVDTSGDGE